VLGMKRVALTTLGTLMQAWGPKLADQQEVLIQAADMLIDVYAADSVLLRGLTAATPLHEAAVRVFVHDASWRVERAARGALAASVRGDELPPLLRALRQFLEIPPLDTVALRQQLADAVVERRVYPF
jgi:alkylation response protein AidB-like acyl-CoA dehydrogenase